MSHAPVAFATPAPHLPVSAAADGVEALEQLQRTRRRLARAGTVHEIVPVAVDMVLQVVPAAYRAELRVGHEDRTTASAAATRPGRRPAAAGADQERLSLPLDLQVAAEQTQSTTGTLTVASHAGTGFDRADTATLSLLAGQVEAALTRAAALEMVGNLRAALASNRTIGTAVGLLMASHDLTREQAFDLLRTLSQNTNRKLVQVAAERLRAATQHPRRHDGADGPGPRWRTLR